MSRAEAYRDLAEQCVALAEQAESPSDRLRLLEMAKAWRELAEKYPGDEGTDSARARPSHGGARRFDPTKPIEP